MSAENFRKAADLMMKRADEATDGPWYYNSYSRIDSPSNGYYEWEEERLREGHSLERDESCEVCGSWTWTSGDHTYPGRGCKLKSEDYNRNPTVAKVPSSAGDSAHGRHAADARHIAAWNPKVTREVAHLFNALASELERKDYTVESDVLPTWLHAELENVAIAYLSEGEPQ